MRKHESKKWKKMNGRDSDSKSYRRREIESIRRRWMMMKLLDNLRESLLRKRPREMRRRQGFRKRYSSRKSK